MTFVSGDHYRAFLPWLTQEEAFRALFLSCRPTPTPVGVVTSSRRPPSYRCLYVPQITQPTRVYSLVWRRWAGLRRIAYRCLSVPLYRSVLELLHRLAVTTVDNVYHLCSLLSWRVSVSLTLSNLKPDG